MEAIVQSPDRAAGAVGKGGEGPSQAWGGTAPDGSGAGACCLGIGIGRLGWEGPEQAWEGG